VVSNDPGAGGSLNQEIGSGGPRVRLNSAALMPLLGLGTYTAGPGEEAVGSVLTALEAGYRLIDTSLAYWNEPDVGAALRLSGVPRKEVFITSKLENIDHGHEATLRACERTLKNLGLERLDLYLVHWPVPGLRHDTWRAMERLYAEGLCTSVGVSNYMDRHLDGLLAQSEIVPAVNQIECHPFLAQAPLLDYCRTRGIALQAYSPLAKAQRLADPTLRGVAERHGRTTAQVMLRWQVERGVAVIPKSVRPEKLEENSRIFDFALTAEDHQAISALDAGLHLDWDPSRLD
jgi:diketogulonate reductase-like aldo/keto reductase